VLLRNFLALNKTQVQGWYRCHACLSLSNALMIWSHRVHWYMWWRGIRLLTYQTGSQLCLHSVMCSPLLG
jgi:hypothetical protein